MKNVAKITIARVGEAGKVVTVTLETKEGSKPTLTYNAHGWIKPMTQGEFTSMVLREGLKVHPKNPKFKVVKDEDD